MNLMITGLCSLRVNHRKYSIGSAQHTLSDYQNLDTYLDELVRIALVVSLKDLCCVRITLQENGMVFW